MKCARRARIDLTTPLRDAESRLMGPRVLSDPVTSALLLIVAIAYLVGAFVVITALSRKRTAGSSVE